jgi:5-methylcytosine-specific restriction endonuclease McrA
MFAVVPMSAWPASICASFKFPVSRRCTAIENGQRCTATTDLTVHRITPLSEGGSMYDLSNLTTLCRAHHGAVEGRRSHAQV